MYSKLPQGDGFKLMNPIQTQTYQALTDSDESVYVSAPAGSGKSVCAELAILRAVETHGVENARCVYCAPIDDIAEARYADWKVKFEDTMGIPTCILTGDVATDLKCSNALESSSRALRIGTFYREDGNNARTCKK